MKKKVNKSAVIRDFLIKNPSLSATEIVAQLSKNGTTVSVPLVYQVLRKVSDPGTKKSAGKRGPKPGLKKTSATAGQTSNTGDLFAAMQSFVTAAGGLDKAISILNVFKS